jgi:tRNA pseudouridine32 synthase/23S rRNA pseudouridine746 synthase
MRPHTLAPGEYDPPHYPFVSVVHLDDQLIVLSKPAGLLSVPGKATEHADCLEARAQAIWPEARIVHRLDMATSGLMVLARGKDVLRHLGLQFEKRKVAKKYIADIWGAPSEDSGEIDLPLITDWPNRPLQKVDPENGRRALTRWQVMEGYDGWTRIALFPETGRSHQLRVHMKQIGHPILGDVFYASGEALTCRPRLHLHAEELTLHHPSNGERVTYTDHSLL